jgi:hypothetical protein
MFLYNTIFISVYSLLFLSGITLSQILYAPVAFLIAMSFSYRPFPKTFRLTNLPLTWTHTEVVRLIRMKEPYMHCETSPDAPLRSRSSKVQLYPSLTDEHSQTAILRVSPDADCRWFSKTKRTGEYFLGYGSSPDGGDYDLTIEIDRELFMLTPLNTPMTPIGVE